MPIRIDIIPSPSFEVTRAGLLRAAAGKEARMAVSAHAANLAMLGALRSVTPIGQFGTFKELEGTRLIDSYGSRIKLGDPTIVRFTNARSYFKFVDRGHGDIYPVKAKSLRFVGSSGDLVFTQHVRPTPAQQLRIRAVQRAMPELVYIMDHHAYMVRNAIEGLPP